MGIDASDIFSYLCIENKVRNPFLRPNINNHINLSVMKEVKEEIFVDYVEAVAKGEREEDDVVGGEIWYN